MQRNGSPSTVLKLWIKYVIVLLILFRYDACAIVPEYVLPYLLFVRS